MARVLICDKLGPAGVEMLEKAGLQVENKPGLTGEELRAAVRAADGVIVRSATKITAELLEDAGKLRAVARAGVGVDNIDVAAATRKGIVVMNTPGGNTLSAAEHTIALMTSLARHVPRGDAGMKAGQWERGQLMGTQLTGKTIGVVGLGRIGQEVAKRAAGLGMKVIGYDPFITPERAGQLGIEAVRSLDELLPSCDWLTVHVPLTEQTRGLIGRREFGILPDSARVLNVSRGGVIDELALAEALTEGRIAGAGLDVFEQEPPPADHPLLKAPNVVLTPHLGASTVEAQDAVAREAAQLLIDFLTRGVIQFAVNMAAVDRSELDELRLYVDLARRLGMLHAQIAGGPVQKAELTYRGGLAGRGTKLLTSAFTAGLLEASFAGQINVVNAELMARERGIEIVESSNPRGGDFANLMHSAVTSSDGKTRSLSGTLFGNQYVRLVQFDAFRMESFLDGTLLLFTHRDVPGLIGFIGTIFGKHGVNIAAMTVGRQLSEPGGEAIAVLNLDSEPPAEAIAEVNAHPQIFQTHVVKLPKAGEMPAWFG